MSQGECENLICLSLGKYKLKTELNAGFTTFLTMAYIIFVNPTILAEAGIPFEAATMATLLAAAVGTLLVGLFANAPLAMAPGMGLNAAFTYSLVVGHGLSWQQALGVVFLSGLIFAILAFLGWQKGLVAAMPLPLRRAIAAGIGLFICFIGLKSLGLITEHQVTLVTMGRITPQLCVGVAGLILTAVLLQFRIKGAIIIGIGAITAVSLLAGWTNLPKDFTSSAYKYDIFMELDIVGALKLSLIGAIFSFMFVDCFDSIGTLMACAHQSGHVDDKGNVKHITRLLGVDAIASLLGAIFGTSTTTTYIESGTGIAAGGRTGYTAITTAVLFLLMIPLVPIIQIVPTIATAPALVLVGVMMMSAVNEINFRSWEDGLPALLTMIMMPLSYSISNGLVLGFVSYIVLQICIGKIRKISLGLWSIGILCVLELILR
ncbi:MAG: NCS2 family permease [Lentisphaeria bacterium]|nr:NCS2 family permease [Lentisphaeria bacterium]